ncbi:MAG: flagellar hook capping FlgD N-terminal domain-containing protein [Candidatus Goldiibacteriota bacterium]
MDVSGVGSTNSLSETATSMVDNPDSALGKMDFLEMLITKLKYQDPLKPMEDESFVADMAQFSSLEQMTNLNQTFADSITSLNDNIIGLMMMQNTTQAASLIGKNVAISTEAGNVEGQVSAVRFADGDPKIVVNGQEFGLSSVTEIKA